jgi:hypothetical protein
MSDEIRRPSGVRCRHPAAWPRRRSASRTVPVVIRRRMIVPPRLITCTSGPSWPPRSIAQRARASRPRESAMLGSSGNACWSNATISVALNLAYQIRQIRAASLMPRALRSFWHDFRMGAMLSMSGRLAPDLVDGAIHGIARNDSIRLELRGSLADTWRSTASTQRWIAFTSRMECSVTERRTACRKSVPVISAQRHEVASEARSRSRVKESSRLAAFHRLDGTSFFRKRTTALSRVPIPLSGSSRLVSVGGKRQQELLLHWPQMARHCVLKISSVQKGRTRASAQRRASAPRIASSESGRKEVWWARPRGMNSGPGRRPRAEIQDRRRTAADGGRATFVGLSGNRIQEAPWSCSSISCSLSAANSRPGIARAAMK